MRTINIIHLGLGNIGKELIRQVQDQQKYLQENFSVDVKYVAACTSKTGLINRQGIPLTDIARRHDAELLHINVAGEITSLLNHIPAPFILIDTTASEKTVPIIQTALQRGGYVVLSNKKPLAGLQDDFDRLYTLGKNKVFYETTVGAGLPIIQTLQTLIATGDEVLEIQGCFSGTLGFIFSELEKGRKFSKIVIEAMQQGYTEPDPRDDLSGTDVARKALILSRLLGRKIELSDIVLDSLYPKDMDNITKDAFIKQLPHLDQEYLDKMEDARKANKVLRFIANISPERCEVQLAAVEKLSDIGNSQGPDNIVVMKTKRYWENPLVIKGPGAGIAVTAAGVFGDIIRIIEHIFF